MSRHIAVGFAVVVVAALALAACGEDSEVSTVSRPAGSTGEPGADVLEAFQECMSEQGVEVPDGPFRFGGPPDSDSEDVPEAPSRKQLEAMQECRAELPARPEGEGGIRIAPPPSG